MIGHWRFGSLADIRVLKEIQIKASAISDIQIIAQFKSEKCDMGLVDGASAWTTDK